jgi:hypothetical protein
METFRPSLYEAIVVLKWFTALMLLLVASAHAESEIVPRSFVANIFPSEGPRGGNAYRVKLDGHTLLYSVDDAPAKRIVPTRTQWLSFRHALDELDIWTWPGRRPEYRRPSNIDCADCQSESWSLRIEYSDHLLDTNSGNSDLRTAAYPGSCYGSTLKMYRRYLAAVQKLLGKKPFGPRVMPIDAFELGELRLVATHPSLDPRNQWADFRDPTGKTHRIARGTDIGASPARIHDVSSSSVTIREVCLDENNEWLERTRVVQKSAAPD